MRRSSALLLFAVLCPAAWGVPVAQREFDLVLKRTPDVAHGAALYDTCAACHGKNGEGVRDGTVPAIARQPSTIIAKQLVNFRVGARADARMAHFADSRHLAYSQHIADVAAYIATLPPPPPQPAASREVVARGALVYTRSCERCHGAAGEGKEDSLAPRLASQHSEYLMRQLVDAAEGRRPPMASTHSALVDALSREDRVAVTSYLATAETAP